ncbi:MAG TPA: MFS transporter [Candidatus Binataceae bacterium]|jgi:predicted MFS family arabinose efflux permease|nr:MFS transporter [Candidatus Binataceae bacterium]
MVRLDRQRTIVLAALFIALFFIVAGTHNTIPIFITPLIRLYGWPHSRAVIIPTIFTLVWGLSSPVVGWMVDRFEVHRVMVVGTIVTVVGMLLAAESRAFLPMVSSYVVIGVGSAMASTIPLTVIAARWFGERRGFAMGVAVAGMSAGGVILPPITDYIIRTVSIGAAYVALSVPIALVALPLVAFVIRRKPPGVEVSHTTIEPAPELPGLDTYEAMRSAPFWILIAAIYLGSISLATLFYFITPSLIHAGFSSRNAALVQSGQNLIAVPGLIIAGILADRFTGRKVAAAMLAGLAAASILLMEAGSGSAAWPLYVAAFMVVFGLSAGVTAAVFPVALAELVGLKRFGTLAGLMSLASTFGMATGPLLVGRFFDSSGNYAMGFEVGAWLCLASAAMTLMLVMANGLTDVSPAQIRAAARH